MRFLRILNPVDLLHSSGKACRGSLEYKARLRSAFTLSSSSSQVIIKQLYPLFYLFLWFIPIQSNHQHVSLLLQLLLRRLQDLLLL